MKYLYILLLFALFFSCKEKIKTRSQPDPVIVELNNKMVGLTRFMNNPDSCKKALSLLDQITEIDSNDFLAYYNKLMFYNQLKQYESAANTLNKLIQLRPQAHDLYLTAAFVYEKIGDTLRSQLNFKKSLEICDRVLDTMRSTNEDYRILVNNKGVITLMLNDSATAKEKLQMMYDHQKDEEIRGDIMLLMNKSKPELIQQFIGD